MNAEKPRVRVKAGATAFDVGAAKPPTTKATMRYLRGDRSGILAMRRVALDFLHNSGWIAGAADQIVADTIGTELKLNARPDLAGLGYDDAERAAWSRLVEAEWKRLAWNPAEC